MKEATPLAAKPAVEAGVAPVAATQQKAAVRPKKVIRVISLGEVQEMVAREAYYIAERRHFQGEIQPQLLLRDFGRKVQLLGRHADANGHYFRGWAAERHVRLQGRSCDDGLRTGYLRHREYQYAPQCAYGFGLCRT